MITPKMLTEWSDAKTLAIKSLSIEPSIVIAMQEMFIEAKWLRRDNLRLLNSENLINKMALYIHMANRGQLYTHDMDSLLDEIEEISRHMNKNLGLKAND